MKAIEFKMVLNRMVEALVDGNPGRVNELAKTLSRDELWYVNERTEQLRDIIAAEYETSEDV